MSDSQNKKLSANKNDDSDESSSLSFLQSDKELEDNDNDQQQIEQIVEPSKKKKDSSDTIQKAAMNQRKRDRYMDEPITGNNLQSTFLYKPEVQLPNLFNFTNLTIKVIIAAQYVTKDNPAVLKHKIYGTDTYSANSDCVCICLHAGIFGINSFNQRKCQGAEVSFKVIKPKKNYNGTNKNGIVSETIKNYNGNAIKPESIRWLSTLGSLENLQRYAANMRIPIGRNRIRARPQNIQQIIALPETNLVFNMNNQPAFKYSAYNIGDKGFNKAQFMIKKLQHKVLYLQTSNKQKYQLYKFMEKTYFEAYRFSRVKNSIKYDNLYFSTHSPPLPVEDLEVLESLVEWDEIVFGDSDIQVKDKLVENIVSFKYYPKVQKEK